jgi:hypothetical protein
MARYRNDFNFAKSAFSYLVNDFGYELQSAHDENTGWDVCYASEKNGVGVKVIYEKRESLIMILIYKLKEEKMIGNESPISSTSCIRCVNFCDALDPEDQIRPGYSYGNDSRYLDPLHGSENYIKDAADLLKTRGHDLLSGDLTKFDLAAKVLRARALAAARR